ncbi:MAG: hypothetical protein WEC36_10835 [Phycisphaeraceae bacterium]
MFTLSPQGYFTQDGQTLLPVGVNYWPASVGVEMWPAFPEEEIQQDLDLVKRLGLDTIRFFLRWQDFEPQAGVYNPKAFADLRRLLTWSQDRHLLLMPTLFVGYMSGGTFWPQFVKGKNLFTDPALLQRATALAAEVAKVLQGFPDIILAVDQGNELDCLPESWAASPAQIAHWSRTIADTVRRHCPGCLVMSGTDHNTVINDCPWQLSGNLGLDLLSMHGYPVPAWHPLAFDGLDDPLCQDLLPQYTRFARTFGPVMLQEFGSILTTGPYAQRYLETMLEGCFQAGANGFLWWCLHDVRAHVHPYIKNGFEATLGLVHADGTPKSGPDAFLRFARDIAARPRPNLQAPTTAVYIPAHYYRRDNPLNPGNQPNQVGPRAILAAHMLQRAGHDVRMVRGDLPLPDNLRHLLLPGVFLTETETMALTRYVQGGGNLYLHGIPAHSLSPALIRLLGAAPVNYRAPRAVTVQAFGQKFALHAYLENTLIEMQPTTGVVLARTETQLPALLENRLGAGRVRTAIGMVEQNLFTHDVAARDRFLPWYQHLLGE